MGFEPKLSNLRDACITVAAAVMATAKLSTAINRHRIRPPPRQGWKEGRRGNKNAFLSHQPPYWSSVTCSIQSTTLPSFTS
jgi:hypothetical protein